MRDSAATIRTALNSLVAQSYENWELLVFDDGSRDDSERLVRAVADPRVRLFVDGTSRGLAARLNQAIDLARGRYLARMDADDVAYPDRLAKQVAFLDARPDIDLVGAEMMVFAGSGRAIGLHVAAPTHERICADPYRGFYLPHPTWVGRLEWFRRWRYDESFDKAQDQELLRRAFRESRYAALAEPLVGYRQDRVSIAKSWRGRRFASRSILQLARRERELLRGWGAVTVQAMKALADTLAIVTGLERTVLRHRAAPCRPGQAERWDQIWRDCRDEP